MAEPEASRNKRGGGSNVDNPGLFLTTGLGERRDLVAMAAVVHGLSSRRTGFPQGYGVGERLLMVGVVPTLWTTVGRGVSGHMLLYRMAIRGGFPGLGRVAPKGKAGD